MSVFLSNLAFALSVTGPIILVLSLGVYLKLIKLINDSFIDISSKLVFNVTLPALLFIVVSEARFEETANLGLVVAGVLGTIITLVLMEVVATFAIKPPEERGVVVQGAFRSNMGIVGLAYTVNAYGDAGLAASPIYIALITILYNILSVITLNRSLHQHNSVMNAIKGIVTNPLIIGIMAALPFSYFSIEIPAVPMKAANYIAQITLPLALLCAGGSLSLAAMRSEPFNAAVATVGKVMISPLIVTTLAGLFGFRGLELGMVFLMASSPSAAAGYIMVRAMGGNSTLAANIIVLSTFGSIIFTSLGLTILRGYGLI
jgi:hypothetical protein